MIIKQLSVFVENKSGSLAHVTEALGEANINISALNIVESEDYGVLRMILSDVERAASLLRDLDYSVTVTEVLGVLAEDEPGSLSKVLRRLSEAEINLSYMYGYSDNGKAMFIIKVKNNDKAVAVLSAKDQL